MKMFSKIYLVGKDYLYNFLDAGPMLYSKEVKKKKLLQETADIFHMEVINGKIVMKVGLYDGTGLSLKHIQRY